MQQAISGAPVFHDVEVEKQTADDELYKLASDPGMKVEGLLRLMKGQYEPDDVEVKNLTIEQSAKLKQKLAKQMAIRGDFLKKEGGSFAQNLGVVRFDGSGVQQKAQMAGLMTMKATLLNENGLLMKQLPTVLGAGESEINVCDMAVHLDEVDVGDEVIAKCGSLIAEVIEGPVELFPDEQQDLMATVPDVTKTTITDLGDGVYEVKNDGESQGAVVVKIGDSEFQITPGGTASSDSCGTLHVQVDLHTIGSGDHPGVTREGIPESEVRVFDKSEGSCAHGFGVSWQHYPEIYAGIGVADFEGCEFVAAGTTADDGSVDIPLIVGDYIVITEYDPDPTIDGDELYINAGRNAGVR